jgi:integrase
MPGKRAKILSVADVGDMLAFASCTRHPLRNAVMVLLSAKAGLRAGEIANLTWDMVVDANGQISGLIELCDTAAKKFSGRSIPVHPDLMAALATWRQVAPPSEYVIASERGGATCNCWQATGRSRPRSGTSTATPMPSASSFR